MSKRCRICGEPKATQQLFDEHPDDCDCAKCCAVCWREFGRYCEEPDAGALLAEIDRLRALVEEAYLEGFSDGEHSGDSYHHGYGAHRGDETWHDSDARAAIDSSAD